MIEASRRSFLRGLGASLIAAPAIVRVASLMPVRGWAEAYTIPGFTTHSPNFMSGSWIGYDGQFAMSDEYLEGIALNQRYVALYMSDKTGCDG